MKKLTYFILLVFYFQLVDSRIHAQTKALIIEDNNGTQYKFDLEKNIKLEFKANTIVVSENENGTSIPFSSIQTIKFENTASANVNELKNESLLLGKLYPNPVKDLCQLEFESFKQEIAQVKIYSLQGQLLQQQKSTAIMGKNMLLVPTNELPVGYYICEFQLGTNVQVLNFIKQ